MRPPRRRSPLEHVLVAGDVGDIAAIRALLALLPATTYGQVYVEAAPGEPVPDLGAPRRVSVTVLDRCEGAAPGERLAAAVAGWVAEWLPEETEPDRTVTMWVGRSASARLDTSATCLERL